MLHATLPRQEMILVEPVVLVVNVEAPGRLRFESDGFSCFDAIAVSRSCKASTDNVSTICIEPKKTETPH